MESTIDRKAYRRNSYDTNYESREKVEVVKRNNSIFLNKIINAMLLFLFVLLLKFFYFEEEFEFIKETFNSGYSYEEVTEIISEKVNQIIGDII